MVAFTAFGNITGLPAISLPLHRTDDGFPVGAQLVGAPFCEAQLIRLGHALEAGAAVGRPAGADRRRDGLARPDHPVDHPAPDRAEAVELDLALAAQVANSPAASTASSASAATSASQTGLASRSSTSRCMR